MYNFNYGNLDPALFRSILIFSACCIIIDVIVRVFLALAVHNDGKAIGVKNKTLWSVLTFFFPVIVGIIYLCARTSLEKTVPRYCTTCGETMPPNTKVCYNCSGNMLLDYVITDAEKFKKLRKIFLILGIVVYLLLFIISQIFGVKLVVDIFRSYDKQKNYSGYEDYFNDYFDNFGKYFEEHGSEEQPGNGDNDFFDDFNNFGADGEEGEDGGEQQLPDTDPFDFFDDFGN